MDISTVPMSGPTIYSSFVSSLPGTVHGPFFLVTLWLFTETTILSFANHNVYQFIIYQLVIFQSYVEYPWFPTIYQY